MANFRIGSKVKVISSGGNPECERYVGMETEIVGESFWLGEPTWLLDLKGPFNVVVVKARAGEVLVPILPAANHAPCEDAFAEDFNKRFSSAEVPA